MFQPLCPDFMVEHKSSKLASMDSNLDTNETAVSGRSIPSRYLAIVLLAITCAAAVLPMLSRYGGTERSLAPSSSNTLTPALSVLPDFTLVTDVVARKQQFFDFLEAYVNAENKRLLKRRE